MQQHQLMLSEWLQAIGKIKGLSLSLGADGHCTIHCDDFECFVEVPKQDETKAVFVYSPLMQLPQDQSQQLDILKAALEMNMFGLRTGSCQLSFDKRTEQIVLTFAADIDMLDEDLFSQILGDFLDVTSELNCQFKDIFIPA